MEAAAVKIQAMERGRQERKRLKEPIMGGMGWGIEFFFVEKSVEP